MSGFGFNFIGIINFSDVVVLRGVFILIKIEVGTVLNIMV